MCSHIYRYMLEPQFICSQETPEHWSFPTKIPRFSTELSLVPKLCDRRTPSRNKTCSCQRSAATRAGACPGRRRSFLTEPWPVGKKGGKGWCFFWDVESLVGGIPTIWKSVGMMTFPTEWKVIIQSCSKPPTRSSWNPYENDLFSW